MHRDASSSVAVKPCRVSTRPKEFIKSLFTRCELDLEEMRILDFAILAASAVNRVSRCVTSKIHDGTVVDSQNCLRVLPGSGPTYVC